VRALPLTRGEIDVSERGAFARLHEGRRCSFLQSDHGVHACEIHNTAGHAALPITCRMFPRQVLHDPRGTFISLSHYCPTAAGMLFDDDGPVGIVDAPASLTGDGVLDGLDARDVWPPVLRPGVMMDLESYTAWEQRAIELLTRSGIAPRVALRALSDVTARIAQWTPSEGLPLEHAVLDAFGMLAPPPTAELAPEDPAVKRWLAARLFGTWLAYQGNALGTIVRYLHACHDVFSVELARDRNPREAIRRCDQLIVHESSSQQLAILLNSKESEDSKKGEGAPSIFDTSKGRRSKEILRSPSKTSTPSSSG